MSRRNDCGARHGRGYRGAVPEPRGADSRFVRDHSLRVMQYGTTQGKPPVLPLTSPPRPTSISRSPPAASHPAPFVSIFKCLLTISTHNPSHQGDDSTHGQAPYLTPAALHVTPVTLHASIRHPSRHKQQCQATAQWRPRRIRVSVYCPPLPPPPPRRPPPRPRPPPPLPPPPRPPPHRRMPAEVVPKVSMSLFFSFSLVDIPKINANTEFSQVQVCVCLRMCVACQYSSGVMMPLEEFP